MATIDEIVQQVISFVALKKADNSMVKRGIINLLKNE